MIRRMLAIASALLLTATLATAALVDPTHVLACSGPGAWRVMTDADIYASWCAFWVAILLVPVVYTLARSGHPMLAAAHLLLLILHPSWTVSAWHGDCGDFKRMASTAFVILAGVAVPEASAVALLFRRPWPWRREKFGVCRHCGYNLTGNVSGTCPECGTAMAEKSEAAT
jgi:hypothetical protein